MAAGFEVQEELVQVRLTDPTLRAAEIWCALISIGELQEAATLADIDQDNPSKEDLEKIDRLITAFAGSLRSWNLTRRGRAIPTTLRGVKSLGMWASPPSVGALNLVEAWMTALADHHTKQLSPEQVAKSLTSDPL